MILEVFTAGASKEVWVIKEIFTQVTEYYWEFEGMKPFENCIGVLTEIAKGERARRV